jgi:hypothetical protein
MVDAAVDRIICSGDPQLDHERILLQQSLLGATIQIEQNLYKPRTFKRHLASLRTYATFIQATGFHAWPPSQATLEAFASYQISYKNLDPNSVSLSFKAISGFVQQLQNLAPHASPHPWCIQNHAASRQSGAFLKCLVKNYKLKKDAKQLLDIGPLLDIIHHGFDDTRFGLHQKAYAVLATFMPGRQRAVSNLRLSYTIVNDMVITDPSSDVQIHHQGDHHYHDRYVAFTIRVDKNLDPGKIRYSYVPAEVCGFAFMDCIIGYIMATRPLSGNYFMAAPAAATGFKWRTTPYSNFNSAFQTAAAKALPGEVDPKDLGGGTPRKSLAQLLHATGADDQQLADIGGWKLENREAMKGYCHTTPRMHLTIKASLPGPSY